LIERFLEPVMGYLLELSFCRILKTVTFEVSTDLLVRYKCIENFEGDNLINCLTKFI
jgi:hypothetical protein